MPTKKPIQPPKADDSKKFQELETKIDELTRGWQRTQADFVNFRKRTEEDRQKLRSSSQIDVILSILPVVDNFRLSTQHLPKELENNNWAEGIQHIERQLEQILTDLGVERIEALGEHFNPAVHEAIETVASDQPEGMIVEESSVGYKLGDQVIRASRVKVASGESKVESSPV
jgi:molecular chaperone GrpE